VGLLIHTSSFACTSEPSDESDQSDEGVLQSCTHVGASSSTMPGAETPFLRTFGDDVQDCIAAASISESDAELLWDVHSHAFKAVLNMDCMPADRQSALLVAGKIYKVFWKYLGEEIVSIFSERLTSDVSDLEFAYVVADLLEACAENDADAIAEVIARGRIDSALMRKIVDFGVSMLPCVREQLNT